MTGQTLPAGVAMGSRRDDETLPAYMYRHAFDWARERVPDDMAADYAAWCRDAVAADPSAFDYWTHPAEWPVWLESPDRTRVYAVQNLDWAAAGGAGRVRCQCGHDVFTASDPVRGRVYSGRFVCAGCGATWQTRNIVQRLELVEVTR